MIDQRMPMTLTKPAPPGAIQTMAPMVQPAVLPQQVTQPVMPVRPDSGGGFQHGALRQRPDMAQRRARFQNHYGGNRVGAIQPRIGPMGTLQQFQDGGVVEEERTTTLTKNAPQALPTTDLGTMNPPTTPMVKQRPEKSQARLGGEFTETTRSNFQAALRAGIKGLAEEAQATPATPGMATPGMPAPSPGAIGVTPANANAPGPDQAGQVQRDWKGTKPMSNEEYEAVLKSVDPDGTLPKHLRDIKILAESYNYYMQKGDSERAKKFAITLLGRSRMYAAIHGDAAIQAIQNGDPQKATALLQEGFNSYVPNGDVLLKSKNGLMVVRDAFTGKVKAEFRPTPQDMMAAAMGLKNGQSFWESVTYAAGEGLTEKDAGTAARGEASSARSNIESRAKVAKELAGTSEGAPTTESGEPINLVKQSLAKNLFDPAALKTEHTAENPPPPFQLEADPTLGAEGATATTESKARYDAVIKPIEQAVTDVATDLVMHSGGEVSTATAADIAAKLARVDFTTPTNEPFKVRQNRDPKTKKKTDISLWVDGEVYNVPNSALPQLKKIVSFQQKMAAATAEKLGANKKEVDDAATKEQLDSEAFRTQEKVAGEFLSAAGGKVKDALGGFGKSAEASGNAAYEKVLPYLNAGSEAIGSVFDVDNKPKPGQGPSTRRDSRIPIKPSSSGARTRKGPAKVVMEPTTTRPIPKTEPTQLARFAEVLSGMPEFMKNVDYSRLGDMATDVGEKTKALTSRKSGVAASRAIENFVSSVAKSLTRVKSNGAVGARTSPPTRARVEAAAKEAAGGKSVPSSVIDDILQQLHDKLVSR